jgi:NADH-quinone oxidoreductase subunit J
LNDGITALVYATFVLGGLAVYFLLPGNRKSMKTAGVLFGLAGLVGAAVLCGSKFLAPSGSSVIFYLSAGVAVVAAVKVVTHERPVYSALYFVLVILSITPLLILQEAEFLAIALVIVYAGAILVTYVFVIMLSQQGDHPPIYDRRAREPFVAALAGFATMAVIAGQMATLPQEWVGEATLVSAQVDAPVESQAGDEQIDNTEMIGRVMLTRYLVALEIAGVLLLVAMIGAIAVSRKRVPSDEPAGREVPLGKVGREVAPY